MQRTLLLFLLFGFSLLVHGQNSVPDKLEASFFEQLSIFPQEKIYLHTDKPY